MRRGLGLTPEQIAGLDSAFAIRLTDARMSARLDFEITVDGPTSVSIAASDPISRFRVVRSLIDAGFSQLGVTDSHVHVDADPTLTNGLLWLGRIP